MDSYKKKRVVTAWRKAIGKWLLLIAYTICFLGFLVYIKRSQRQYKHSLAC